MYQMNGRDLSRDKSLILPIKPVVGIRFYYNARSDKKCETVRNIRRFTWNVSDCSSYEQVEFSYLRPPSVMCIVLLNSIMTHISCKPLPLTAAILPPKISGVNGPIGKALNLFWRQTAAVSCV